METANNQASPESRESIESRYTFRRIVELALDPVRGNYDAAHLKEIHRRIFQDLPALGIHDITPGKFRSPVEAGKDWVKNRALSSAAASFMVAYSPMDRAAQERLNKALAGANPKALGQLKTEEFSAALSALYIELDYLHPFPEGNSRTLRSFTAQLARDAGYELNWEKFMQTPAGRDILAIGRDLAVNDLALPRIQDNDVKRQVVFGVDRLEGNPKLGTLLRDAIRPLRAVAFERLPPEKAISQHPELETAYKALTTAAEHFAKQFPGNQEAQLKALQGVQERVQDMLNKGEIRNFGTGKDEQRTVQKAHPIKANPANPELER